MQGATGLFEHSDKVQQVQMCPLADFTCIVIALGTGMQVRHIVQPRGPLLQGSLCMQRAPLL